jgi:hypothetical protein
MGPGFKFAAGSCGTKEMACRTIELRKAALASTKQAHRVKSNAAT